jgi:hypothetical protein
MHCYIVAGLTVRSEVPLPELVSHETITHDADVEIRFAPCPTHLPQPARSEKGVEIAENEVLLKIEKVGRYHIKRGREIYIEAEKNAQAEDLRLFLLGSALGAIYFQRGLFPLHASVVVLNGAAVAFTGDSGAGKSTMAAWMNLQGYPLLCDDVCVVRFDDDTPIAYPAFPRLKLWKDALSSFDINTDGLQRDYSRADKFHMSPSNRFWNEPVPLRHVNVLQFSDAGTDPCIEDLKPASAVHLLRNNTYRFQYISGLGLTRSHFLDCVRLARSIGVHYLNRPRRHSALAECQQLIEQQML